MRIFLKSLAVMSLVSGMASTNAWSDDNIAACEIVVQQKVTSQEELSDKDADDAPLIATFIPAEDFVFSVFDGEDGHLSEVNGHPIQALMCQRQYLIPTEFDLRLIETHVPLYLSQDFDSSDSDLMAVFYKDDEYHYQYSGKDLNEDSLDILKTRMKALNAKASE